MFSFKCKQLTSTSSLAFRTTSSSSGVSSGGPSSVMRFPSTSSGGSTAPSPPVQLRRYRLHTQTSMEASLSSLQPLESPQEVTTCTTTDSATSAASSPDVQSSFLSSSSAPARDLPPCLDGHHASKSGFCACFCALMSECSVR